MNLQILRGLGCLVQAVALALTVNATQAQQSDVQSELNRLFEELNRPDQENWAQLESEIVRLWSRSGSEAMNLILRRGNEAIESGDLRAAVEHFSALTEQAPDFAEGWNGRATAYYLQGNLALSIADIEQVLSLNPRHFGALAGLSTILEQTGDTELALRALRTLQEINPNRPEIDRRIQRLERETGAADL